MIEALGDLIRIQVQWQDNTPYGTSLSGRLQTFIRDKLHPNSFAILQAWIQQGRALNAETLTQLVKQERSQKDYKTILQDPNLLTPNPSDCYPTALHLQSLDGQDALTLALDNNDLVSISQALQGKPTDNPLLASFLNGIHQRLQGFVRPKLIQETPHVMIGHATLCWSFNNTRLWVDPFFLPKQAKYQSWQPLSVLDLPAEQHYVLFTHSHPDHFDCASLLLFPPNTVFFVIECAGETALSLDIGSRLRQLGFHHIKSVTWWESIELTGFSINALPFYGEQAVGIHADMPLLWNEGVTWHIRCHSDQTTWWILADSGSDPRCHIYQLARLIKQRFGSIDYLCGNCRRWRLYPEQYIASSVPHYLLVTPDKDLGIPQTIMLEPTELATVAEICQACYVIPYAMGGTPWFSALGLGYAHTHHQETEFDTDPREALKGSQTLLRLNPRFQQLDTLAGSSFERGCVKAPESFSLFHLKAAQTDWRILTLTRVNKLLSQELKALAELNPRNCFILAPEYAEIWLDNTDKFSQHLIDLWLTHYQGSYLFSHHSTSLSLFYESDWWQLAITLMQESTQAILKGDWIFLINYLQQSVFKHVPAKLLVTVYTELTLTPVHFNYNHPPSIIAVFSELALPKDAKALHYTNTEIGLALLLSKILHNHWLTQQILELNVFPSEQAFTEQLINQVFLANTLDT